MENEFVKTFTSEESKNIKPDIQIQSDGPSAIRKRNILKWHRTIGLITIIPVIFWSLSGLMHPFLSHWFKPTIAREFIVPKVLDKDQVQLSIQQVLKQNNIQEFKNFRLVSFDEQTFYQVKQVDRRLNYYNSNNGKELNSADKKYAEFMARYFLNDQKSPIKSIVLQTEFDQQYKYINRYLPVWKVSFDRSDNMDVFVETTSSRMATFNTSSRKVFLWVFDNFHNWSFLDKISSNVLRISIMLALLCIIMSSALSGLVIYGLFWNRFKKLNDTNEKSKIRKYHRQIGIATACVAFTFTLSGAFHATRKLEPNLLPEMIYEPVIKTNELSKGSLSLNIDWERLHNLSIVRKGKINYFQAFYVNTEDVQAETIYLNAVDGLVWINGDVEYAKFLGKKFLKVINAKINMSANCCEEIAENTNVDEDAMLMKAEPIPKFENREYGFVFKRLPVIRLVYNTPDENTLYVETSTSRLAATINNTDRMEGYSFAIFHKYLFMDWAGKNVRDITMMLAAFGLLTVSILGLIIFVKKV